MRDLTDDRGATIIIVAISMVALIGIVGLVIDLGRIFEERRELSRGVDAAVLAIATDCGIGAQPCDDATAAATGEIYADANTDDGTAAVDDFVLDVAEGRIWMRVETRDGSDSSNKLPMLFLAALGLEGTTVKAEATAEWYYPSGATALPLIISDCEYFRYVDPVEGPDDSLLVTIYFHDGGSAEPCNATAGHDTDGDDVLPGGFGWLATEGCYATILDNNWVYEDPGASPSTGCTAPELRDLLIGDPVVIPYFWDVQGLGANGQYEISGFGGFNVVGYNLGGQFKEPSAAAAPCSGDERCISGYFTSAVTSVGSPGGQDRGLVTVKLVG